MAKKGILYVVYNDWISDPANGQNLYKIGKTSTSVADRYYGLGLKMPGKFETLFETKYLSANSLFCKNAFLPFMNAIRTVGTAASE